MRSDVLRRWLGGWIPFWIYNALVIRSALLPVSQIPPVVVQINDKLLHSVEYFWLCLFSVNAFEKAKTLWLTVHPYYHAMLWCFLMGLATEWGQFFTPDRAMEAGDWLADIAGAALGVACCAVLNRLEERFRQRKRRAQFSPMPRELRSV